MVMVRSFEVKMRIEMVKGLRWKGESKERDT